MDDCKALAVVFGAIERIARRANGEATGSTDQGGDVVQVHELKCAYPQTFRRNQFANSELDANVDKLHDYLGV